MNPLVSFLVTLIASALGTALGLWTFNRHWIVAFYILEKRVAAIERKAILDVMLKGVK